MAYCTKDFTVKFVKCLNIKELIKQCLAHITIASMYATRNAEKNNLHTAMN